MDTFEQDLEGGLTAISDGFGGDGSDEAERRILSHVSARREARPRWLMPAGGGIAAAAVLILGLNAIGVLGSHQDTAADRTAVPSSGLNGPDVVAPGEPCADARHASPEEIALETSIPVWLPTGFAVTDSWTCGSGDTPILLVDKSIQISYEAGWGDIDVDKKWADLARDEGGDVQAILGRPALVKPSSEAAPSGQVMIIVDGTLIRLLATSGVPIENLVDVARAIDLDHPLPSGSGETSGDADGTGG